MGLFGGFRAKFTRNSKSKETTKEVVCLKYLVHSEFDPVNTSNGFVPIRPALRKNSFTPPDKKQKRVQVKSQIIEKDTQSWLQVQKSKSVSNIVDIPPPPPKTPPPDITTETKFLDDTFRTLTSPMTSFDTNTTLRLDNIESNRSSKSDTALPDYYTSYDEPSTLILMTQHSSEPSPSFRIMEEEGFSFVQESTETNHYVEFPPEASDASTLEADDFHVNVMDYSNNKRYSMSEDEVSNNDIMEENIQEDFMEYSSQASSIFFGNDMQPVPTRRRMITLQDDDGNNRRSSEEDGEC